MKNEPTYKNLLIALKKIGLKKNDIVFCHSNLGYFGKPRSIDNIDELCNFYFKAILKILGSGGTLIVPTFTYSFFLNKIFSKKKTKSLNMGIFSEWLRSLKNSVRSEDPNYSVCAFGNKKEFFTTIYENKTFSDKCFFSKFHQANGKILNFNFPGTTLIHYYENLLKVSYRFHKIFKGKIMENNQIKIVDWKVFSRRLNSSTNVHDPMPLMTKLRKNKKYFTNFGKGEIFSIESKKLFQFIKKNYLLDNKFLTTGYNRLRR